MEIQSRREFLGTGFLASVITLGAGLSACNSSSSSNFASGPLTEDAGDLGTGDTALFNVFYSYKLLTTALLTKIVAGGPQGFTIGEIRVLADILDQEQAHKEFLRSLAGAGVIPELSGFDFTSVPIGNRSRILDTLKDFEDIGVQGWNGSLGYFASAQSMASVAQIAARDGRHASVIREMKQPGTTHFAAPEIVGTSNGLTRSVSPFFVFSVVRSYGPTPVLDSGDLP